MASKKPSTYVPARTVYIGLRRYDPETQTAQNCRGLNIRAFDFTPQEVHDICKAALEKAAEEIQRINRGRELVEK